eukprot:TRINITY_DN2038_c0_g1_i2.p1 TRINITY_DN2038_c0_g1~~TRINITY_DN2038_c0_g1_i2.p1  ORF type:complete len:314 (+),score=4.08 TRINITY_DN2038_c0_g1_i2:495-1436(+)
MIIAAGQLHVVTCCSSHLHVGTWAEWTNGRCSPVNESALSLIRRSEDKTAVVFPSALSVAYFHDHPEKAVVTVGFSNGEVALFGLWIAGVHVSELYRVDPGGGYVVSLLSRSYDLPSFLCVSHHGLNFTLHVANDGELSVDPVNLEEGIPALGTFDVFDGALLAFGASSYLCLATSLGFGFFEWVGRSTFHLKSEFLVSKSLPLPCNRVFSADTKGFLLLDGHGSFLRVGMHSLRAVEDTKQPSSLVVPLMFGTSDIFGRLLGLSVGLSATSITTVYLVHVGGTDLLVGTEISQEPNRSLPVADCPWRWAQPS